MRLFTNMALAGAIALGLASTVQAQDSSGKAALQRAVDFATSQSKFTADFEVLFDARVDEEVENFTTDYTFAYRRPGNSSIHMNNRYMELLVYSSESGTTRYVPELEQYLIEPQSTSPSELIRITSNEMLLPALAIFAEFTKDKPLAKVLNDEKPITLVGEETVNDILCDRIRFDYADFTCDIWVDKGTDALVHRIEPDMSGISDTLVKQGHEVESFLVQLTVLHWQPGAVDESLLTYTPKDSVEKVAQFYRPQPPSAAEGLVGKVAPAINLNLLSGETFDLASKKGKEIVVLDFWATWCGPCRMGMPILSKVTKEFADKGVRMYAVNLQEGPDQIKPFLESTGLDVSVLLDVDGKMGAAYMAESIPQMVIVGKDGLVKKVHIGVTPNYEDDIRAELTELTQ